MANKYTDKLDLSITQTYSPSSFYGKEVFNYWGKFFEYKVNWTTQKFVYHTSNCAYYKNPGFVCPLSAYREPGLIFIN